MTVAPQPPAAPQPPVSLYVHFPFCLSICPYCDFVVYAGRAARGPGSRIDSLVDALIAEIELRAAPAPISSVYLGGGTPSLMSTRQLAALLSAADRAFGIAAGAEITLEANPGSSERGDMAGFRAAGINRLSIGAQSFDPTELARLGRRHSPADIQATVAEARSAGIDNVSIDLLYDVPGQTSESWQESLDAAIALAPDHISAYALSLDDPDLEGLTGPTGDHLPLRPGARRWRDRAREAQDAELAAHMYEAADQTLAAAGLDWYEISNWSRPGRESRHNLVYWQGSPWEAVGPGAHAFDGSRTRRWNSARLDAYVGALTPTDGSTARLPPDGSETTDEATTAAEAAILGLRTRFGIAWSDDNDGLRWALANGLAELIDEGRVRLTRSGRLMSNEVFQRLLPASGAARAAQPQKHLVCVSSEWPCTEPTEYVPTRLTLC